MLDMLDMFKDDIRIIETQSFSCFVSKGDKKGAIDYLRKLTHQQFNEEVLKAGFSMIGLEHGKSKVMDHVIRQFN